MAKSASKKQAKVAAPLNSGQPPTPPTPSSTTTTPISSSAPIATTSSTTKIIKPATASTLIQKLSTSYFASTPASLQMLDAYMMFIASTGIVQFVYMLVAGTYPYNAFLSGFIGSVGSFVLAANLRLQSDVKNPDFKHISQERAFADFVFGSVVFYAVVISYIG